MGPREFQVTAKWEIKICLCKGVVWRNKQKQLNVWSNEHVPSSVADFESARLDFCVNTKEVAGGHDRRLPV